MILKLDTVQTDDKSLISYKKNINFEFIRENHNKKLVSAGEKYDLNIISFDGEKFSLENDMKIALNNKTFYKYFVDLLNYSEMIFNDCFDKDNFYNHGFIGNSAFKFMSKGGRTLKSPDVIDIINSNENNLNIYLFVRKSEVEGIDYYFIGKLKLIDFKETTLNNSSIVQFTLSITPPVDENIYDYLVN